MKGYLRQLRRDPVLLIGAGLVVVWAVIALTARWWVPFDPIRDQALSDRLQPPSLGHWFGTDELGRDVFSRVMAGAGISLPLGVVVVLASALIGSLLGAIAGLRGGRLDELIMRIGDVVLSFPAIVLALAIAAALGPALSNVMIAIVAVLWPEYARLMRGQVLSIKNYDHVLAARAIGCSRARIFRKHILPYSYAPIVVKATLDLGSVILIAAGLSFIGVGAVPPAPEWGAMITESRQFFSQWWLAAFPGLAILTTVMGFNFVGDGVRDLLDPRMRSRL